MYEYITLIHCKTSLWYRLSERLLKGTKIAKILLFCRQLAKLRMLRGIRHFCQDVTIKLTHVFMVAGWWVTVDFDSWGETRAHGVPIHEKKLSWRYF